jgi:trigger factor
MPEETPIATLDQPADDSGGKPPRLEQSVTLADVGPCRKHVRVVIDRKDIDLKLRDKFNEMMPEAQVPGYRPGKAPRKLIEKKFFKEVSEQIKGELLLQSLEQLAEDYKLNPIAQPNIDPFRIELPEEGPFTYEFEIEVAPEFELPDYKGLRLKRPVKDITPAEMETAKLKFLRRFGQLSRKEGGVELEDRVVADVLITLDDKKLNEFKDLALQVDPQLAFTDGVIPDFGAKLRGAKAGETRQLALKL